MAHPIPPALALSAGPWPQQGEGITDLAEIPLDIAYLLATLVVVVTPGTGVVYTLAAALSHGRRAGVAAAFGCTLGAVPHLVATISGLAALLHTGTLAYEAVKYLGAGYLLYMAWATLRDKDSLVVRGEAEPRPAVRVIVSAVLVNLLNPKPTLFFVAFLPQFVPAGASGSVAAMLRLGAVFMALTLVVFTAYALCAAAVRDRLAARPGVATGLRRAFAVCFVALSVRLAVA
ncbi:Homoserine/homoserine lactone efflux protein [Streptomyces leeuwenhoekii]|uniref:Homoserine/homoserine lactone efflux protein n=1 Tax=Streptomyces leeuwenhoekii TaxID=1437453 RepID=A0A0F7W572_STRLW|nr:Homoserine/homoserine lactone efflux protein [Streptomyces leeuwenhoekii]